MQPLNGTSADATRLNELLNARIAHAYQGKFRGCKEGVGRHQEQDQKHPEQHKSDH